MKSLLTDSEFQKLRYFIPKTTSEQNEVKNLGLKAEKCWKEFSYNVPQPEAAKVGTSSTSYLDSEKCLIRGIGETAYKQVYQNKRPPSHEEYLWFEKCYGKVPKEVITYSSSTTDVPDDAEKCLQSVLTGGLYEKVKRGEIGIPGDYRTAVDRCFGIKPQPFEKNPNYKIAPEIESCLKNSVSEERFNQIKTGKSEPTSDEKKKANSCFAQIHELKKNFLPNPPEQVPYIDPDPEVIQLAGAEQEVKEIRGKRSGGKIKFSGKAPPNSIVTVYIFSEPIVVTTKTDENGDWVYELSKPLEGETHIAYATVRKSTGDVVRSSVFDFQVQAAADRETLPRLVSESEVDQTQRRFILYTVLLVSGAILTILVLRKYIYINKIEAGHKSDREEEPEESSNNET